MVAFPQGSSSFHIKKFTAELLISINHLLISIKMGTSIEEEGGMETEIAKRVGAGWMNWKKCSGVFCDKKMPVKRNGKVYRTVVRPAMLYGAETWATTKRQESRIEVNEMRMLRWMCGVTRKDKIRNEHIRGTTKVAQASRKITDRRLKSDVYLSTSPLVRSLVKIAAD